MVAARTHLLAESSDTYPAVLLTPSPLRRIPCISQMERCGRPCRLCFAIGRVVLLVIVDVLLLLGAEILFGRPLPPTALAPYARRSGAQREDIALLSELAEAGSLR
jgi:hypothetical protein